MSLSEQCDDVKQAMPESNLLFRKDKNQKLSSSWIGCTCVRNQIFSCLQRGSGLTPWSKLKKSDSTNFQNCRWVVALCWAVLAYLRSYSASFQDLLIQPRYLMTYSFGARSLSWQLFSKEMKTILLFYKKTQRLWIWKWVSFTPPEVN